MRKQISDNVKEDTAEKQDKKNLCKDRPEGKPQAGQRGQLRADSTTAFSAARAVV